ncbi:ABC transporter ATP-binding protein [Pantoea sp. 18069]|uniref:ABC transporter ATP-binding protein n=1 Tax=Pantoea sp. 18069 TaxID=2681415 RepID=UPI00135B9CF3|nr:ABC transporter ATP-binding protein [Pantoea sp. 18069]
MDCAHNPPTAAAISVRGLAKHYAGASVFSAVSFDVAPGEFVAIVGESGVGKSTLLNCLAGLDHWDAGRIAHDGIDLGALGDDQRAVWRRAHLGFVFQAFHVLPHLDVAQNVGLPLMLLGGRLDKEALARVEAMLGAVGLAGLGTRLPQQLSGGQLQRVAIARALVHRPRLLLADEPTGNLDPATATRILDLLTAQAREAGAALVLATHSREAALRADRVLQLRADGIVAAGIGADGIGAAGIGAA